MNTIEDRVMAFAGVLQASAQVTELAHKGHCNPAAYQPLIDSLFKFDATGTLDVYGGQVAHLSEGLNTLKKMSGNRHDKTIGQIIKIALSLLALEKQAGKSKELLDVLHARLSHLEYKRNHFNDDDNALAESLSGLYQDTLSQLKFRVIVNGNMQHLNNPLISDKIRALLLAGFRSAILWRQVGGKKWQLIFSSKKQAQVCDALLEQME